jgi:RHS repeat-associated protein
LWYLADGGYNEGGNYYFYITDHLGNNRIVADAAASVVQSTQYYPFGMPFADATGQNVQPYKYNNKELDGRNGLNWYDSNMRYYDFPFPHTPIVDPHAENYFSWSPYNYVGSNPIKRIDPTGMDWYFFDENNDYSFKSKKEGEHRFVRKEVDKKGNIKYTFGNFADPENDSKSIDNGDITSLYLPSDDELVDDLLQAGAYSQENRDNKYSYMKDHSHAGTNSGELDFVVNSGIFGKNIGLPSNYLYVRPDRNGNPVGHNNYNFGNYLWGAAANALGVGLRTAKMGAHINNLVNDPSNQGKSLLNRTLDSNDDQYSITQGWYWRESISNYGLKIKKWKK